jgi:hypothetical protein
MKKFGTFSQIRYWRLLMVYSPNSENLEFIFGTFFCHKFTVRIISWTLQFSVFLAAKARAYWQNSLYIISFLIVSAYFPSKIIIWLSATFHEEINTLHYFLFSFGNQAFYLLHGVNWTFTSIYVLVSFKTIWAGFKRALRKLFGLVMQSIKTGRIL